MLVDRDQRRVRAGTAGQRVATRSADDHRLGVLGLTGIGIGGIIGAGYFLGSGIVIRQAGPAILLTFLFGGLILAQVMGALATMATHDPRPSYRAYVRESLGVFPGYLLGWVVFVSGVLGLGSEAVAMATYARLWLPTLPLAALAVGFSALALALNALGTRRVGQSEAVMSFVKVALLVAFVVVAVAAVTGWLPHRGPVLGLPLVTTHGLAPHGLGPVLGASLIAVFSYSGVTAVAMATGRARHPARDVPASATATVLGVTFLYLAAMAMLLLLVPWQSTSTRVSPFTQALARLPVPFATPLFNALILIASFSVMAGGFYATAWMLASLARTGEAPRFLRARGAGRLGTWTVGLTGLAVLASLSAAYLLPKSAYTDLTSAGSYFTLLNWAFILLSFLGWRRRRPATRPLRLAFGAPYGTVGAVLAILALAVQSARSPSFRPGLWTFLAVVMLVSAGFLAIRRTLSASPARKHAGPSPT